MSDRLIRGAVAGALAALWLLASEFFWHNLTHIASTSWLDAQAYLIVSHPPRSPADYVIGFVAQLVFSGLLGGLFCRFALPKPGTGHHLLRGLGYGAALWWLLQALATLLKATELATSDWKADVTTLFSALTWGLLLAWLVERWDRTIQRT